MVLSTISSQPRNHSRSADKYRVSNPTIGVAAPRCITFNQVATEFSSVRTNARAPYTMSPMAQTQ